MTPFENASSSQGSPTRGADWAVAQAVLAVIETAQWEQNGLKRGLANVVVGTITAAH